MRSHRVPLLGVTLLCSFIAAAQTPAAPPAPTTRVLAIGHIVGAPDTKEFQQIMPSEVRDTVKLYLAGKLDQWFVRQDKNGVVFLLNASSIGEANALLANLPLVQAKRMEFELIPLGPLTPLRYLLGGSVGGTKQ